MPGVSEENLIRRLIYEGESGHGRGFFTAFKALDTSVREAFFEKILKNRRIREDLMDAALIDEAKKVKGKPVSAKDFFATRRKTGDVA